MRIFSLLDYQGIKLIDKFRADAASCQFEVIQLLEHYVTHCYIGTQVDYVGKYFPQTENRQECKDSKGETIWVGDTTYIPFDKNYKAHNDPPKMYRLVVKKKPNKDGQINLLTGQAFENYAIITNEFCKSAAQIVDF